MMEKNMNKRESLVHVEADFSKKKEKKKKEKEKEKRKRKEKIDKIMSLFLFE